MAARVLVVDDDTPIRNMVVRLLQFSHEELQPVAAEDGARALELLGSEDFQLMIIDYTMPDMDGMEVIARLRQSARNVDIPVIMLTARSDSDHVARSLQSGATYFVAKPFEPQELLDTVGICVGLTLEF